MSKRDNIGNLIVALFALIGIILFISLIFGIFFRRHSHLAEASFSRSRLRPPEDVEIIQLHLR